MLLFDELIRVHQGQIEFLTSFRLSSRVCQRISVGYYDSVVRMGQVPFVCFIDIVCPCVVLVHVHACVLRCV